MSPPLHLHKRRLVFVLIRKGAALHRFYKAASEPIHFDRSNIGRFNAPDASYGVLYAAPRMEVALAETFLRAPSHTLINRGFLLGMAYAQLRVTRTFYTVCLSEPGLAAIGTTAEVSPVRLPYDNAQAWSKALADHPARADGIAYGSRHARQYCYAIFDRAAPSIVEAERRLDLDADWFWRVAERYRIGLAP